MSLGSRIVTRGGARAVARLAASHREPLLFLYPAWARYSSTYPSIATTDSNSRPRVDSADNARASNRRLRNRNHAMPAGNSTGLRRGSRRQRHFATLVRSRAVSNGKEDDTGTTAQDYKSNISSRRHGRGLESSFCNEDYTAPDSKKPLVRSHPARGDTNNEDYSNSQKSLSRRLLFDSKLGSPKRIANPSGLRRKNGPSNRDLGAAESQQQLTRRLNSESRFQNEEYDYYTTPDAQKQLIRRLASVDRQASDYKEYTRAFRTAYQEGKRQQMGASEPDWRAVLSALRSHTPQDTKWLEKALQITVPKDAVATLMYGVDTSMWQIAARYNCTITIDDVDKDAQLCNSYFLSGSETAIKLTTLDLLRIVPDMKLTTRNSGKRLESGIDESEKIEPQDSNASKSLIKKDNEPGVAIRRTANMVIRTVQTTRADKFPRPKSWTKRSFHDYVYDLTNMKMPVHVHSLLYRGEMNHRETVSNILRGLFEDPECLPALSRQAFNVAMVYFMKTSQMSNAMRLFQQMETLGLNPDVETFNIMLRAASRQEDLQSFQRVLRLMLQRDIAPNPYTWLAFVSTAHQFRVKMYIVAEMRERGLLTHTRVIQGLCELLAPYEVRSSLEMSEDHEAFLHRMDSKYGRQWLDLASAHQILHVLSSKGLISRCWEFMRAMEERHVLPDPECISIIMHCCRSTKNIAGAIEFFRDLPPYFPKKLGQDVYHHLFQLARRLRAFNLARVVWRYACLNGATTWRMKQSIRASLGCFSRNFVSSETASHRWKQQLGYFVIGHTGLEGQTFSLARYNKPDTGDDGCSDPTIQDTQEDGGSDALTYPVDGLDPPTYPGSRESRTELFLEIDERLTEEALAFEDWEPARPFGEILAEAWRRDREWKSIVHEAWVAKDTTTTKEVLRLPWLLQRAVSVPVIHKWRPEEREWS